MLKYLSQFSQVDVSKLPRTAREAISAPGGASNPGDLEKLRDSVAKEERKRERVQCIPFYTLLLAMGEKQRYLCQKKPFALIASKFRNVMTFCSDRPS